MKEFITSARAAEADDEDDGTIVFKVDEQEVTAYPPSPGQLAMMYHALSEYRQDSEQVAGVVDFFFGLLDEDSQRVLAQRLMNRKDSFELEQITEIMSWLTEEWSARPTTPSETSSPLQKPIGPKSTGRSRNGGSTRGASASIVSAT